jgi:Mg2+/Co2+ transporter CorB
MSNRRGIARSTVFLSIVVFATLTPTAQAYVDPNSVGPIYQFLFPLLVAIASLFGAFKRALKRMWNRLLGVREAEPAAEAHGTEVD